MVLLSGLWLIVDVSPYKTLLGKLPTKANIMVDDDVRSFVTQNLIDAGALVLPRSSNVAAIRETKSVAEINILRAVSQPQMSLISGEHCNSRSNPCNSKTHGNWNDGTCSPGIAFTNSHSSGPNTVFQYCPLW
jgi:hypothetical protein